MPLESGESLDSRVLLEVTINPEQRVKVTRGPAPAVLLQKGWSVYLVRVDNQAGTTARLRLRSPQAQPVLSGRWNPDPDPKPKLDQDELEQRWLDLDQYGDWHLTGLDREYKVLQLYSRDAGKRMATLEADVGQGTQDLGFRAETDVLFQCEPAFAIPIQVRDELGPCVASFEVRDARGHTYPPKNKRLAPDFFFQNQVYRRDGETLQLPAGRYWVEISHGPEYRTIARELTVPGELDVQLERWVDPAQKGYLSSDPHIHAAGCGHYSDPTQGVSPDDMWLHVLGEDLKMAASLNWGPCYYYQRQFHNQEKSDRRARMRQDVEVSGFGSHKAGHLVLLGLKQTEYSPKLEEWPTLCLNTLRWAKRQGAVCGFPHTGWGLEIRGNRIPSDEVPRFDGVGACEYVVDVTHRVPGPDGKLVAAVDFVSAGDTPWPWELNVWYHTLNCGFRTVLSGETDFPCITGNRVGQARVYVKSPPDWVAWREALRQGKSYVSDGKSHLMGFAYRRGAFTADVAAWLPEKPQAHGTILQAPYWELEKARIGATREVPLELVVDGLVVARKRIVADGQMRSVHFPWKAQRRSWAALRILPSSHTNVVWIGPGAYLPSRKSALWCLKAVDRCWHSKKFSYNPREKKQALEAYEHARRVYRGLGSFPPLKGGGGGMSP